MDREVMVGVKILDEYVEFPFPVDSELDEDEIYSAAVDCVMSSIVVDVDI